MWKTTAFHSLTAKFSNGGFNVKFKDFIKDYIENSFFFFYFSVFFFFTKPVGGADSLQEKFTIRTIM